MKIVKSVKAKSVKQFFFDVKYKRKSLSWGCVWLYRSAGGGIVEEATKVDVHISQASMMGGRGVGPPHPAGGLALCLWRCLDTS